MAGTLDSLSHFLLVFRGCTRDTAGKDLALFVHKLQEEVGILVIDIFDTALLETAPFFVLGIYRNRGQLFNVVIYCHRFYLFSGCSLASCCFLACFFSL